MVSNRVARTIYLEPKLAEQVKDLAKDQKRSVNALIEVLLEEAVAKANKAKK